MPFIAAAMSLVAAAERSVRVASGAFRLSPRSRVFFSTRLFIVISLGDELYAGSRPCFLMTGAATGAVMTLTSARAASPLRAGVDAGGAHGHPLDLARQRADVIAAAAMHPLADLLE